MNIIIMAAVSGVFSMATVNCIHGSVGCILNCIHPPLIVFICTTPHSQVISAANAISPAEVTGGGAGGAAQSSVARAQSVTNCD